MVDVPHADGARWERTRQTIADAIDAACDEATNARDHEIAVLMRKVEALKWEIGDREERAKKISERARDALAGVRSSITSGEELAVIEGAIEDAVAEALPRWVPVGERLPEVGRPMLVTFHNWPTVARDDGGVSCAVCVASMSPTYCPTDEGAIVRREWRDDSGRIVPNVTAWQPLPAPWVAP